MPARMLASESSLFQPFFRTLLALFPFGLGEWLSAFVCAGSNM